MTSSIREDVKKAIMFIVYLILEVSIFFIITKTLGGIGIPDFRTAFLVIILLSLVNAILWPLLSYFSLRFIVVTLGFGTFLIDGILLYIISLFIPSVHISGIALFSVPLLIGLISSLVSLVLNIDDDDSYYHNILEKEMKAIYPKTNEKEGFIFLEIDGLSHHTLRKALENGDMPTLSKWLSDGSHKLARWETDLSSQTSSSQAGILHGNNNNIPAFRWVEKEKDNRLISSNGRDNSELIERRISNGKGLLSNNGASRSNLFSGDATDHILTFSKFAISKAIKSRSWYYLYSKPYAITRILILFIFDMIMEFASRMRHLFKNIQPRLKWRGLAYYVARAGTNVAMREATTLTLIGDILAGNYNAIYATYMGYDEIAHHSGVEDYDSFYALRQIDRQFKRLEKAMEKSARTYKVIVLSDHGQSNGFTFKEKYGESLNDLVKDLLPDDISVHSILHSNDDHFREKYSLKPYVEDNLEKVDRRIERSIDNTKEKIDTRIDNTKERIDNTKEKIDTRIDNTKERIDSRLDFEISPREKFNEIKNNSSTLEYFNKLKSERSFLNSDEPFTKRLNKISTDLNLNILFSNKTKVSEKTAQTLVLSSGNLGLIYFTDWSNRMTYEQIEDAFPGLISGLAHHEGIGFVMVKSDIYDTIVLSNDDVLYLDTEEYYGNHFLDSFGENTIRKLKRTDEFAHVPDILVNSAYDIDSEEVYAFEELIGSHGGAGGNQQYPFILYPSEWSLEEEIFGSENVYKFFKSEMEKSWNEK
ncbi:alkaline phosphatase family protein [Methanobrevibacter ruminantium]|uniref:alkaline phosphatase family protein n=1 Tax=Methanobrevibacter ruminantium TaxID=83816 RepID=UPI0026EA677D|nr:alkaline phosphatase family protein [Methanobrevibacter ruminantium]MCI5736671.1 alkaline phosphatase family protein [Methanobrevibacter ruminantium]